MVRAPFFDKNGLKKGAWSQEEDDKLKAYVERYGHWNWRQLPKFAGLSRCGKSCRLRWLNYLKPGVKLGNFCREEEDLIFKYHEKFGNRWSMIAAKLPGRSDNEVKNYWHTSLKKKLKEYHSNCNCVSSDSQEMVSTVRNTEQEAVVVNVPCHSILESCISSPDQDSCSISTSCCSSSGMVLQDQQLPISGNCVSSDSQEMVSTVRNTEQEAVAVNVPCHPILESCISLPDQDSCSISTSCCSSSGMILQDQQLPISGDFWTEPFIEDKYTFYQDSSADLSSFQDWDLDFVSLHNYPSCDQDTMYAFEFNGNGLF